MEPCSTSLVTLITELNQMYDTQNGRYVRAYEASTVEHLCSHASIRTERAFDAM